MAALTFITHVVTEDDYDRSHITDLEIIQTDSGPVLVSTTRYDGVLRTWDTSAILSMIDEVTFDGGDVAGGTSSLTTLHIGDDIAVLTGGATGAGMQLHDIGPDGSFGLTATLPAGVANFQHGITIQLDNGTQVIYGAIVETDGIVRLDFTPDGDFTETTTTAGPAGTATETITATTALELAGQTYLLTTSATQNNLTTWEVGIDGGLTAIDTIDAESGLWVSAPSAMDIAQVDGTSYVVLASAGSSTLSVMEIGIDGSLILRDHLVDNLETRFGGVTSLAVVTHDGRTYVIAGGADDGLSVFILLDGGRLVAVAHIADTTEMGLDNISAIAAVGSGDGIDIFVASSSEAGITQLHLDTGTAGITLTAMLTGGALAGTDGNDILQGHDGNDRITGGDGDDILRDGAGSDVMTGGTGADIFILSADGEVDTITNFTLGEDLIDLSHWPMLRDISQLTFTLREDGLEIHYGDEVLIIQSADGELIDYRELTNGDLITTARFPSTAEPGYPGPAVPAPDIPPDDTDPPSVDQGAPFDAHDGLGLIADANNTAMHDAFASSSPAQPAAPLDGSDAADLLIAGADADILSGGGGDDLIIGRGGNDQIGGGDGADWLLGGDGHDTLTGGNGHDRLQGGDGDDILSGGAGDDSMTGGLGADTFVFEGGTDTITDFTQGEDIITIDPNLWTGLTSAEDVLMIYGTFDGTQVTIDLGNGDILMIEGVTDHTALADSISLL